MAELVCSKCGLERGYAGANIADIHETCSEEVEFPDGRTATFPASHDWEENR